MVAGADKAARRARIVVELQFERAGQALIRSTAAGWEAAPGQGFVVLVPGAGRSGSAERRTESSDCRWGSTKRRVLCSGV